MRWLRRQCRLLVPLALWVALAGCGDTGNDLSRHVLASIPRYTAPAADSGPLDRNAASQSLPTRPSDTAKALDAAGFQSGYSRVFLRGGSPSGDYVLVTAYEMASHDRAKQFVSSERQALQSTGTVVIFAVDGLPDSLGFTLTGSTQRGGRQVFCDGVALASSATVYAVTTCSAMPVDSTLATDTAKRQAAAAG